VDAPEAVAMAAATADARINKYLEGKEIKKKIYVPGKILNLIVPG
jgi:leucyl-tRNA synthetase